MVVAIDRRVDLEPVGIGDGLREARLGQGLALADVEHETCIRAANLEAIESERFDALPGDVYAAGFIRTYADHLGLDGAVYAERFRQSREVEPEPVAPAIGRHRRRQLLAAASALLAAGLVAFVLLRGGDAPGTPAVSKPGPPLPLAGPLTIRATGGATWVAVRFGGAHGPLVRQGTLRRGRMLRFGLDRPLWVGIGRPENASVRIGTKRVRLVPARHRFVVGSHGVRPAAA